MRSINKEGGGCNTRFGCFGCKPLSIGALLSQKLPFSAFLLMERMERLLADGTHTPSVYLRHF